MTPSLVDAEALLSCEDLVWSCRVEGFGGSQGWLTTRVYRDIGTHRGNIRVILGLYWGYIWVILGLYWGYIGVNGKENGNYYNGL